MNQRQILAFVDRIRKAKTFEDAAHTMLRVMLDEANAALAASGFASRGRILRGMAHWRPGDGYRRLVLLDDTQRSGEPVINYLPSASAWRSSTARCATAPPGRARARPGTCR